MSTGTNDERRKRSKDTEIFGTEFGMQMIADQFGDGWHKSITFFLVESAKSGKYILCINTYRNAISIH